MSYVVKSFENQDTFQEPQGSYTIKSFEEPTPSTKEQLKNALYFLQRGAGAQVRGLPRTISGILKHGSKKLQELGESQALEQGREIQKEGDPITNFVVNILGKPEKYFEKFGLPTSEEAKKKLTKEIEEESGIKLPERGRGWIERAAEGIGGAVPYTIGSSPLAALGILGAGGVSEGAELGQGASAATNVVLPVALEFAKAIMSRKYIPEPGESEQVYKALKGMGMTDEQLAPILASEEQVARYGPLAAGRRQTQQAFRHSKEALDTTVENMQNRVQNLRPVSAQQERNFVNALDAIAQDIRSRTANLSPKELSHVNYIEDTVRNIRANGINPRQAIGLWRSINKIELGKKELSRVKEPITKLLEAVDPTLAKEFKETNKAYSRYFENLKQINPKAFTDFVDAGQFEKLLGSVFSGSQASLEKQVLNFASAGVLKKLSSAMITNPNFQSFPRKFKVAVNSGSKSAQRNLYKQFQQAVLKEYPEEYKEINWPET